MCNAYLAFRQVFALRKIGNTHTVSVAVSAKKNKCAVTDSAYMLPAIIKTVEAILVSQVCFWI